MILPTVTVYSTVPTLPAPAAVVAAPSEGPADSGSTIPTRNVEDPDSPSRPPVAGDGGEFLRHINGVEAGRMGGHGLEPSIRGLDQNQLSITNDGAFHFGGCPNRMDPPTSHMQLYSYDLVTVSKGYQSVLDGPPAPGGSIQFERINPSFDPEGSSNFKAGGGYISNGSRYEGFFDMSTGSDWGYLRAFGSYATSDRYEDGDGNEIRSAFDQFGGGVIVGRTIDANSWFTLKVENNNVDNAEFPGSGMDAPVTDDWTYQLKGETNLDWGTVKGVKGDVYVTTVDHIMNNFDLRDNSGGMRNREARMDSDTYGGKVMFNSEFDGIKVDFGTDYRDVKRDGNRYDGTVTNFDPSIVQSILWPDTSIKELGFAAEAAIPLGSRLKVTAGLRYAHVRASADRADEQAQVTPMGMMRSANQLYQQYYGVTAQDQRENNVSGLIRLEQGLGDDLTVFGSVSRAVRTADATERYMFNFMGMGGANSWVGNPNLDPEKHHQADLGLKYKGKMSSGSRFVLTASAYYNSVDDFIQLDSARGQDGILVTGPSASVFRNIDATLVGVDAEAELHIGDYWRVNVSGSYTYGENRSDDIALSQIAPFNGRLEVTYDTGKWLAGVRVNAAAEQNRVDDDRTTGSGRDNGRSESWATLDLFSAYNVTQNFQVSGGVTNLFDETYANHLNKTNLEDPAGIRVNEPGRSFYLRGTTTF